jgi:cytochrome b
MDMSTTANISRIKVWDPLVRGFHWLLVAGFFTAYFTEDDFLVPHVWAGYLVLGLLGLRLVWGLVGSRHARFGDFIHRPRVVLAYLRDTLRGRAARYLGHNPAGGMMIAALLVSLLMTGVSGLALYGAGDQAGPLAQAMIGSGEGWDEALEDIHEFFANFTVLLVAVHVAGVMLASLLHRENLVRAMITGYKRKD